MNRWSALQRGQVVEAQVVEQQAKGGLLVSWRGELLLVQNQSARQFNKDETISLKVLTVAPLSFALYEGKQKQPGRLLIIT